MAFDLFFLIKVETFAHKLERWFGVHTFTLSAFSYLIATTSYFIWVIEAKPVDTLFVFVAFVFIAVGLVNLGMTPYFIRKHYTHLAQGTANPLKIDPKMQRVRLVASIGLFLAIVFVTVFDWKLFLQIGLPMSGMWGCAYFRSCDPLPPGSVRSFSYAP